LHGDYFGGKGVGLAKIKHPDLGILNIYNTHLHAQYNFDLDEYLAYRLTQTYEFLRFIQITGSDGIVIAGGDLNSNTDSMAYKMLTFKLNDTWNRPLEFTSNNRNNSYCDTSFPPEKIDFIFYQESSKITVYSTQMVFTEKLSADMSYSDHFGVKTEFKIGGNVSARKRRDVEEFRGFLNLNVMPLIEGEIVKSKSTRVWYFNLMLLFLMLFTASFAYSLVGFFRDSNRAMWMFTVSISPVLILLSFFSLIMNVYVMPDISASLIELYKQMLNMSWIK
jgi:hypothetical protein